MRSVHRLDVRSRAFSVQSAVDILHQAFSPSAPASKDSFQKRYDLITAQVTRASLGLVSKESDSRGLSHVAASGVPGAGAGLFASQDLVAGTVVALFPGSVYFPEEVKQLGGGAEVFDDTDYLIVRHDGVFIDPLGSMIRVASDSGRESPLMPSSHSTMHHSNVAHYANHSAQAANAVPWPWDVTNWSMLPDHVLDCWPVWYAVHAKKEGSDDGKIHLSPHGLALCAIGDVSRGDEIFFDYSYDHNGSSSVPSWIS